MLHIVGLATIDMIICSKKPSYVTTQDIMLQLLTAEAYNYFNSNIATIKMKLNIISYVAFYQCQMHYSKLHISVHVLHTTVHMLHV